MFNNVFLFSETPSKAVKFKPSVNSKVWLKVFLWWLLCMASSYSVTTLAATARIAVASNFIAPMKSIVAAFETTTGHQLIVAYGSSGKLYAQILHGAPFDVFLSADQTKIQALMENNLGVSSTRMTYAEGRLVLWSPDRSVVDSEGAVLDSGSFQHLALANPRLAPYGVAALDVLTHMGLLEKTRPVWVMGENIAQTFQFVDSGNADLGFVALSQLKAKGQPAESMLDRPENGSLWMIPSDYYRPILQDAILLKRAGSNEAARSLLNFLQSPEALDILKRFGYLSPREVK